jgi:hypothetical protein
LWEGSTTSRDGNATSARPRGGHGALGGGAARGARARGRASRLLAAPRLRPGALALAQPAGRVLPSPLSAPSQSFTPPHFTAFRSLRTAYRRQCRVQGGSVGRGGGAEATAHISHRERDFGTRPRAMLKRARGEERGGGAGGPARAPRGVVGCVRSRAFLKSGAPPPPRGRGGRPGGARGAGVWQHTHVSSCSSPLPSQAVALISEAWRVCPPARAAAMQPRARGHRANRGAGGGPAQLGSGGRGPARRPRPAMQHAPVAGRRAAPRPPCRAAGRAAAGWRGGHAPAAGWRAARRPPRPPLRGRRRASAGALTPP